MQAMMRRYLQLIVAALLVSSCGGNFFKDMSQRDTDAAKYEDALKAIDRGNYQEAIDLFATMSTSFQTETKVRENWAGAYAGLCGQEFITLVDGLANASGVPFLFFMQAFNGLTVTPSACRSAQLKMEEMGTSLQRTSDQNLFMFILGVSKIGTNLKAVADITPADGSTDAGFSSCGNQTGMTNSQVDEVITGFGLILDNLTAIGSSLSGSSAVAAISAFNASCQAATGGSCTITDPTTISTPVRNLFRELIMTSDFGIGTACTSSQVLPTGGSTICCP